VPGVAELVVGGQYQQNLHRVLHGDKCPCVAWVAYSIGAPL
jgi:hypothetical protein